jgi:hypothetical protein
VQLQQDNVTKEDYLLEEDYALKLSILPAKRTQTPVSEIPKRKIRYVYREGRSEAETR